VNPALFIFILLTAILLVGIMSVYAWKGVCGGEVCAAQYNMENRSDEMNEDIREGSGYYDKKPNFVNRGPSKLRETWERGKVYFFVIAASLVFYFALLRMTNLSGVLWKIVADLRAVIYGIVIAYLLNPMMKKIEKFILPFFSKRMKKQEKAKKLSRGAAIGVSLLVMMVIIAALWNMVIPELYRSIRDMVVTLPGQLNSWMNKFNEIEFGDSTTGVMLKNILNETTESFQQWLRTDLLKQTNVLMTSLTEGVITAVSTIFNILIGIIISVYMLFSKETFSAQTKKALYAFVKPDIANMTLHITKKSNEIFGGFIIGKIIDSIIIGVLCFLGMWLFNMPYAMLVSVVVGVTNVIPVFGPYIGAIPSAILILLTNPRMGVYFIIFVFLLQQLDGNVIGPKILGNTTGLSAFWVVFAILLGSGMFGVIGMIMGVPTFAVIYYIVQMIINQKLEKKKLPTHSEYYDEKSYVNAEGQYARSQDDKEE